jgi:phosphate acetyltransferase
VSFLASLHARAAANRRRILFPEAADPRTRQAVRDLKDRGVVEPVLVGTADEAMDGIELVEVRPGELADEVAAQIYKIRSPKGMTEEVAAGHSSNPLLVADALVRWGRADGCVAGAAHTSADIVRAALWLIGPRKAGTSM